MDITNATNIGIFIVGLIAGSIGWFVKLWIDRRRIILVEHTATKKYARSSEPEADGLNLFYKGRKIAGFHVNTFLIYNRSVETIRNLVLTLTLETRGAVLEAVLNEKVGSKNASQTLYRPGKIVTVKADYLNSSVALGGKLELLIYSDQPLISVDLKGGVPGWATRYHGELSTKPVDFSPSTSNIFVAVEGPIGVGKTTLSRVLQEKWSADFLPEEFEENPFLSSFYENKQQYAFHTQLFFLLARYHSLKDVKAKGHPLVSDYIFEKDRLFARLNLTGNELDIYNQMHNALREHVSYPDLVIFLKANVDTLMERIQKRGRPYEKNMDRTYIEEVCKAYDKFFATYDTAPVLVLDSTNLDLVDNMDDIEAAIKRIENFLKDPPAE